MKKTFSAFCIIFILSVFAFAQSADDYKKAEFFAGFSNGQVDSGGEVDDIIGDRQTFNGFNVSAVVNVNRYVGFKADVSGTYRNDEFTFNAPPAVFSVKTKTSLYNVLGGVQIKDNASTKRVKPFAYALVGAGFGKNKLENLVCPIGVDCSDLESISETGLAGAFGGGLDIKLNDRIDFRVVKVDYNPIKFSDGTQHNIRIGIGIVFK